MTLMQTLQAYFKANASVKQYELNEIKALLAHQEHEMNALNRKLEALEAKSNGHLELQIKQLKDQVETFSKRMIGFSKTGIS